MLGRIGKTKVLMLKVFFDDYCPMCRSTVKALKRYVNPSPAMFIPLSKAELTQKQRLTAINYMLAIDTITSKTYSGYDTYIIMFRRATTRLSSLIKMIGFFMQFPLIDLLDKGLKLIAATGSAAPLLAKQNLIDCKFLLAKLTLIMAKINEIPGASGRTKSIQSYQI